MTEGATPLLIAGLGNPGRRYEGTRHNVGFELVDRLAAHWRASLHDTGAHGSACWSAVARVEGTDVFLAKPLTYMNRSGRVIAPFASERGIAPGRCLVVVDDMALPVGTIRFRARGSSGGHNGLTSIEEHFGTSEYPRLRIGIGPQPAAEEWSEFVLTAFEPEEREAIDEALERAERGVETLVMSGIDRAMSLHNG